MKKYLQNSVVLSVGCSVLEFRLMDIHKKFKNFLGKNNEAVGWLVNCFSDI